MYANVMYYKYKAHFCCVTYDFMVMHLRLYTTNVLANNVWYRCIVIVLK